MAASITGAARSNTSEPLRWIINGPALATFATDHAAVCFFANTKPFIIQVRNAPVALPPTWGAIPVQVFPSYAALKRAFDANSVPPTVRAILYDNEAWKFTPSEEQRNFAQYNEKAAELVHRHGLLFISTPAVDLIRVLAPNERGKRYDAFLHLGVVSAAARYADVVGIQAQGSERAVDKYSSFVRSAAAQARAANPKVIVLAGISTNPNGQHVDANVILRAIAETRDAVDGYWFNVPKPSQYCPRCNEYRPDMALEVLRRLGKS
ncbi:MAG: hypothetical protein ACYDDQ_00065 [Vulcanimicrobiaceae bacterium]